MIDASSSPTITYAEARILTCLSQEYGSLARLARDLGITTQTLDRVALRRRTHPRTTAKVRVALRRLASATVHVSEVTQ